MRGFFADDQLLIVPSDTAHGVSLFGEVLGSHKSVLTVALTEQRHTTHDITLDLTRVNYVANSVLDILITLANSLTPPYRLLIRTSPGLALRERLAAHPTPCGNNLRLIDA
ncbi:hypothetical protein [Streptomyces flavofungini]|uniref:hypothetical protein n=1 Tax=Streptomyces flavofungini TaxID=68200 RepID=UPI0034DE2BD5